MKKIVFLGDSSLVSSALKAYQISYDIIIDEIYQMINEAAILRFKKHFAYQLQHHPSMLTAIHNYRDESVIRVIKKRKAIENYYYEKSNVVTARNYRCFLIASLAIDHEQTLIAELFENLSKKFMSDIDAGLSHCN